ncbi:MAG: hypothetical protein ACTSRG_27035, partial [Candidatus Helarchaeota archaeon]
NRQKSKPRMPNKIKPEYETIIYNYITDYPTHGPRRISNELKAYGILISETGVYNVLKRRRLNHLSTDYTSLEQLQDYLDKFIYYYNFKRTNQGYRLCGKMPYQKFTDGKRKLTLPEPG